MQIAAMTDPTLDRRGDALYLVDRDGITWRIHDAKFTGGRPHQLPLGSPAANTRYFVGEDGTLRAYTFGRDRRRETTLPVLLEHLSGAGFCAREPYDPSKR